MKLIHNATDIKLFLSLSHCFLYTQLHVLNFLHHIIFTEIISHPTKTLLHEGRICKDDRDYDGGSVGRWKLAQKFYIYYYYLAGTGSGRKLLAEIFYYIDLVAGIWILELYSELHINKLINLKTKKFLVFEL